jgi:type IV pilus assembly protein PilC
MPFFQYRARNSRGDVVQGAVDAPSENVASSILVDRGLIILSLTEKEKKSLSIDFSFFNRIKTKDVVVFSRQLAVMASASVPIVQALKILVNQTHNDKLKVIISEVADEVDGGAKLSQSLGRYRKVFTDFYVAMIRSGETSGKLDEVLNYLADQQEKDYDLSSKIKGAMIYPIFILSGLVVVAIVMMVFVVPKLTAIITESGAALPFATRVLIATSEFMQQFWYVLILGIGGGVFALYKLTRQGQGKIMFDRFKLKVPVFGKLWQRIYLVRMTRSLSTLIVGGVPLTTALEVVADVVGNYMYSDLIRRTIKEVEDGNSVATLFLKSPDVPAMVSQMMSVGEQTGRLEQILTKITEFYSREVENLVNNMVSLIEPLIMILMGVGVGLMVAAIILPMYQLASSF